VNTSHVLIRIIVGIGQQRDGERLSSPVIDEARDTLIERMSDRFGGVTSQCGVGSWVSPDRGVIKESNMIFESVAEITNNVPPCHSDPRTYQETVDLARAMACHIAWKLNQECVLLTVQKLDTMEFVNQDMDTEGDRPDLSHDTHCTYRCGGECSCDKDAR
jgi:hypothetical protein